MSDIPSLLNAEQKEQLAQAKGAVKVIESTIALEPRPSQAQRDLKRRLEVTKKQISELEKL